MKKIIFSVVALATFGSIFAQNHDNSKVAEVPHDVIIDIEYQVRDFNNTKESGSYGFGVNKTSFAGDNKFHIGADFHWDLNAGIVDDFSMIFGLGPSGRIDISNNCFINAPLNVICQVYSYSENLNTKTALNWGLRFAPSLYCFFTRRFGIFVGPQLTVPFVEDSKVGVGMQAGIAISI